MSDDQGAIHYLGAAPVGVGPYEVWQLYGLDELWEMVRDEDGVASFTQVGAWHRMAELCSEQADQLQRALDQLMVHWPARPGSAAELFRVQTEGLIASMRNSAAAAAATEQPLADIAMALGRAKDQVGVLIAQKAVYDRQERTLAARGVYPGRGATALLSPSGQVPPEGWRQQLDEQARRIMAKTDATVGAAAALITPALRYALANPKSDGGPPVGQGQSTNRGLASAPPSAFFVASDIPAHQVAPSAELSAGLDDPVLSGGSMQPGSPSRGQEAGGFSGGQALPIRPAMFANVLPPGGLIGASGPIVRPVASAPSGIGQQSADQGIRAGSERAPMITPAARGLGVQGQSGRTGVVPGGRRRRRSDPTDPWAVSQGVPAILEPEPEPLDHDPGPGVIGIDR
jgi:hypothetical protein